MANYRRYVISYAFDTCEVDLEPEITDCYERERELGATTDEEAIREAQALQAQDDAAARKAIANKMRELLASYRGRPTYVKALWFEEYDDNGDLIEERKVEI